MTQIQFIVLVSIGLLCLCNAHNYVEEEDVLVLTDENFDEAIKEFPHILVEFYAPWCGHCKKLAPEYSKAAAALKKSDTYVPLAKVDATEQKKVAERFGVQGFPTLKFFNNGEAMDYTGGRVEKDIVSWINKRAGQVSAHLADAEAVKLFVEKNEVAIIYFGESEEDTEFAAFKNVAILYDDLAFAHTTDENARATNSARSRQIVLFKKFDENRNDYSGLFNTADIRKFIDENSFATVMPFNDRAIEKIFQKGNPAAFLFSNDNDASQDAEVVFERVAKTNKRNGVLFSISKPNDGFGHFNRLAEYVGVDVSKSPQIIIVHSQDGVSKYRFESDITESDLEEFIQKYKSGQLLKYLKSEEIPASNTDPVKIVVGKNFQDLVVNNDQDVLVQFYAPWCGHCKSLAPIYEELAKLLASNTNIIIAQCDATANEVPGVNIRGFPTLKFWKNGSKNAPLDYEGERDLKGLLEYIKKHTTHAWTLDE